MGAGTSGSEIALELSASHRVLLAGRPTPHVPDPLFRYAGEAYWGFIHHVLTLRTPIGRKVAAGFHQRGAPLIRISAKDLERAGVVRVPRRTGTAGGQPTFDGGRFDSGTPDGGSPAAVQTVIWATGYRPDLDWIEGLQLPASGWPDTQRGAVPGMPGLYFVGMPFQYALTSGVIGGVDRDAQYVVKQIARRVPEPSVAAAGLQPQNGDGENRSSQHTGGTQPQH
ncbi:MAG TPA: hypothetical protein VF885_17290 [Arthrobacter sp.]